MKTTKAQFFSWELGLLLVVIGLAMAQAPAGSPKPGPEHQKMAYFAGKWSAEGEMKPSTFGPGGKFTYTQNCNWFNGNFALVCHSDGSSVNEIIENNGLAERITRIGNISSASRCDLPLGTVASIV